MDKQKAIVILIILAAVAVPLTVWQFQGWAKRDELRNALRNGQVDQFPPYLRGKQWNEKDLSTVTAKKLVRRRGRERSLSATVQGMGTTGVSPETHAYMGTMVDTSTGMKYLFGLPRTNPKWQWVGIHPDSHEQWIEIVRQETEKMQGQRVPEGYVPYRDVLGPQE